MALELDLKGVEGVYESLRGLKRKRSLPTTPPLSIHDEDSVDIVNRAVHILSTEAAALSHVTRLYQTNSVAKDGLINAVDCVVEVNRRGGKLIICGIGKSGLVGMKTVATMKSLGLACSFMHAAEAVHGDLGDIRINDAVLFITFSGKTAELVNLLPHIPEDTTVMVLTATLNAEQCPLLAGRQDSILLPAPIRESEETSFGVCAPTTSTTVAIAVGDMLALTVADRMHQDQTSDVFRKNHPGGAIGAKFFLIEVRNADESVSHVLE
ncbi:sugar isomerase [Patellaria atrata CBS 101060]|uniref:Sugar isomerase n=1 Tax=Patellaria atrata CBS 101060 TaxID=1346257 RepID=A0A9P4S9K3_9PEZI|nr:sugar isomerase [Patellaria atrata CBS 101060]